MMSFAFSKQQRCSTLSKVTLSPATILVMTILFVMLLDNRTFWSIGADAFSGHPWAFAGIVVALCCLTFAVLSPFALPWTVKPVAIFILILSSMTSYYMDTLGVFIDREMVQNAMVTTVSESKHLITLRFVTHVVIYGALPATIVSLIRVKRQSKIATFGTPLVLALISLLFTVGLLLLDFKAYASVLRDRKDFMASYQPGAPIVGTARYLAMMGKTINTVVQPIGGDAVKGPSFAGTLKPSLTILVIGETARAQNFGLNGYAVQTTPQLSQLPIMNFRSVSSCGTSTAVSLPCMFSKFGRANYSFEQGVTHQNVLDIMSHAGLAVEWWDNNTGHKGLADRIASRSFEDAAVAEFCSSGECNDGIFLHALKSYAADITQDTVLVFHQIGSHGPAYYLRYPVEFETFKPACRSVDFKRCTPQEILNSYDNTIAYTDINLAETITFLQTQNHLSTSLLYVSDHGESLGEGGLYLHGTPYFMAPDEQTKVPMILWMSNEFSDQFNHERDCLVDKETSALSHDNLFHSLLGMLDIQIQEYDAELDFFASCKRTRHVKLQ
ncbi:MAG: phosphoethanolamine--lipid A transferase [Sulfitobacter sp.]